MTKSNFLEYLKELVSSSTLSDADKSRLSESISLEKFVLMPTDLMLLLKKVVSDYMDNEESVLLSEGTPEEIEEWTEVKNAFMDSQMDAEEAYLKTTGVDMSTLTDSHPEGKASGKDVMELYAGLAD